jgi:RNA recognition motif-containing protein
MEKKLYVGNLPYSMTDETLGSLFAKIGEVVSAKVITDSGSGRSKGFGFVEMTTVEDAKKAIEQLNDTELEGRNIKVSESKPKTDSGSRKSFGGGSGNRHSNNRW